MADLTTLHTAVGKMVTTEENLSVYIADALEQYSRDKPYENVVDCTGEDANLMAVPTGWVEGWSRVTKFVYPYTDEDSDPYEDVSDWLTVERVPVTGTPTEKLRFLSFEPASTETVRVWFTSPHTATSSSFTPYAQDVYALAHLVASKVETAKASYYLGLRDSGTDLVDYGQKANEARALARMHFDAYQAGLGRDDEGGAASIAGDMDTDAQYPGASHQTHHWRTRR